YLKKNFHRFLLACTITKIEIQPKECFTMVIMLQVMDINSEEETGSLGRLGSTE
ncbi:unnamed protein product, partial [Prunus brigantina]